jgi:hypothetical protein
MLDANGNLTCNYPGDVYLRSVSTKPSVSLGLVVGTIIAVGLELLAV